MGFKACEMAFHDVEQRCHDAIKAPVVKDILCVVFKFTALCQLVRSKYAVLCSMLHI